ncbi:hypothetical protein V8E36_005092 [Tilletia maclaganii]
MLSLILGPSSSTLRDRRDHLAARDKLLNETLPIDISAATLRAVGDERDVEILGSDAAALTKGIEERKWTASDILAAYIRSARRAQDRLNCLTEVLFTSAVEKAKELDAYFEREGKLIGPLHGVPLSLKDHIQTKGSKITLGFSAWIKNPPADRNSTIVNILEHLGAVPFVRTHIPQTMIAFESHTPLFGITKNPINTGHTPGGSSGGEGALLVADGSVMGVGSDIGGSLRIPAAYSGCYTLKPSAGRWTRTALAKYGGGLETIQFVIGPMARTAADVELIFESVIKVLQPPTLTREPEVDIKNASEYEALLHKFGYLDATPAALRVGWKDPLALAKARGKKLRIGIIYTDGFIKTSPACYRAVHESVDALKRAHGSEIEYVRIPTSKIHAVDGFQIFTAVLGATGHHAKTAAITAARESIIGPAWLAVHLTRLPRFVHLLMSFVARFVLRDWRVAKIVSSFSMKSARELEGWMGRKSDFVERWNEEVWEGYGLDGIIAPVHAVPALHHHGTTDLSMIASGTTLYNVLDNAVTVVPVTRVDADLDSHRPPTKKSAAIQQAWNRWSKDAELHRECSGMVAFNMYTRGRYNSARMAGLPVAVQLIARPYAEETALGLMHLLDKALPPLAQRGGPWKVDGNAARTAVGFGPGTYTKAVYGGADVQKA